MKDIIPEQLSSLAQAFPVPLYAVGGAVRDYIAGLKPLRGRDWDICAPLPPEAAKAAAASGGFSVEAEYPLTCSLVLRCEGLRFQFTSFRTDSYGAGGHSPASVRLTDDIRLDAARRDFKCNAVYYDISRGQYADPLNGRSDISGRLLSPCAPPEALFADDPVRILRMARLCGELGFSPSADCLPAARGAAGRLKHISRAWVYKELSGMLSADEKYGVAGGCARALGILCDVGAMPYLFNGLSGDALGAAVRAASAAPAGLRLAALIAPLGAEEAGNALAGMPLPARVRERTLRLIALAECGDGGSVRAFLQRCGGDAPDVVDLASALSLSRAEEWREELAAMQVEGVPFGISQLAVGGGDLAAAGVPAASIGAALAHLLKECAAQPSLNERDTLIALAVRRFAGGKDGGK